MKSAVGKERNGGIVNFVYNFQIGISLSIRLRSNDYIISVDSLNTQLCGKINKTKNIVVNLFNYLVSSEKGHF